MALSPITTAVILGLQVQGDLGPFTTYTQYKAGRRSIVIFPKIWLSDPTSTKQLAHRNRIRNAAAHWKRLTANDRKEWLTAAHLARLTINGYALWVWWRLKRQPITLATIERRAGITLRKD